MTFSNIGIVGAGSRGSDIALVCARAGLSVILVEARKENLEKASERIRRDADELVSSRIQLSLDLSTLAKADLVIETVSEEVKLKTDLFRQLDELFPPNILLATNSATVPITKIARGVRHSSRVLGLHFVSPVTKTNLIEIIRGVATSPETISVACEFAAQLGLRKILAADFPGFVSNRVLAMALNEAIQALYEGIATAEDIDKCFQLGGEKGLGPLRLADSIGLDYLLSLLQSFQRDLGNPKFAPSPLLVKYVEAGYLGIKTGKGFFEY